MNLNYWMSESTKSINNPNLKLHNEIIDYYSKFGPTEEKIRIRKKAIKEVKFIFKDNSKYKIKLKTFGSVKTRLFIDGSDVDLVIINNKYTDYHIFKSIERILKKYLNLFSEIEIIKTARIPVIKFKYIKFNLQFDLVINQFDGIKSIKEIKKNNKKHPELKYLIVILKNFLKKYELNSTYRGGIGSFLLYNMAICYTLIFKKITKRETENIGNYLLNFFEFYTNIFNLKYYGIEFNGNFAKLYTKKIPSASLEINLTHYDNDIGSGAYKIFNIIKFIKNKWKFLLNKPFNNRESILYNLIHIN